MDRHQRTLYPFNLLEAWLWAVTGLASAWAVQICGCLSSGTPITWQKLTLSTAAGIVAGLIVWCLHFPLRWWLFLASAYLYVTAHWQTITGAPWPWAAIADEHYPLWMACGVVGTFLYSRWLMWEFFDYSEQLTLYLCFYGAFLGPLGLVIGTWFFLRRWRERAAFQALVAEQEARGQEIYRRLQAALPQQGEPT